MTVRLRRIGHGLLALGGVAALGACALPTPQLRQIGPDAYTLTKRSNVLSDRADTLKAQAEDDALAYCKERGRALAVLDSKVVDPDPPTYASATVQFRCVAISP